jgi:hypothetical protein
MKHGPRKVISGCGTVGFSLVGPPFDGAKRHVAHSKNKTSGESTGRTPPPLLFRLGVEP